MQRMVPPEPNHGLDRVRHQLRADGVGHQTANLHRTGVHSRGYLPHVKREGVAYFVTFRLTDSLPHGVLLELKRRWSEQMQKLAATDADGREEVNKDLRRHVERYLDKGAGACHLRRPEIADMVAESLKFFHDKQYLLDDWVLMPNHVHLILWPMPNQTLSDILRSRKRQSARQANLILRRTGERFWQPESYDHWIRNDSERARIQRYIRNNPVTAGLCRAPEDWPWSSAWKGGKLEKCSD
ncbi:MAG: putative methylase [Verrucomicrobiota bacterium]|jgi:REP element-mobilizing transposase RayT